MHGAAKLKNRKRNLLYVALLAAAAAGVPSTVWAQDKVVDDGAVETIDTTETFDNVVVGNTGTGTLTVSDGGAVSNVTGFIAREVGSTGTVTVTGENSTWTNSSDLSVGGGGAGTLTIADGGAVSNSVGFIGDSIGSIGTVTVTGVGSTWTNSVELGVGFDGTGTLTIADGGTVNVGGGGSEPNIAFRDGSTGTLNLAFREGSTGTLNLAFREGSTGTLNIGAAAGDAAVAAGTLNAASLTFGGGTGLLNFNHTEADYNFGAEIIGDGTINQIAGVTRLTADSSGFAGDTNVTGGTLVVSNALDGSTVTVNGGALSIESGVLSNISGFVGNNDGSTGTVTVTGTGSTWTNSSNLFVGNAGSGALTITDGGVVSSAFGIIGDNAGSMGAVMVTGTDSAWTNSLDLLVGNVGSGTLTIADGGAVSNAAGRIGIVSTGTVKVTGENSTWTSTGELLIGEAGTGTLTVADGGAVSNTVGFIGDQTGGVGTVTVNGENATWTNSGGLFVGLDGTGTLTISDGGTVSNALGSVGGAFGTGTVMVTGAGSSWTSSDLVIGNFGVGSLTVESGGSVNSSTGRIASSSSGTGTVTVTGENASWINAGSLSVGNAGSGSLTIADGATVSNTVGFIGELTGSTGTGTVTGAGSTWTNDGDLTIGRRGDGTLTIENGGVVVSNASGVIGDAAGRTGAVTVTGENSTWTHAGALAVGLDGTGTLTIADGGTVNVGGGGSTLDIAFGGSSTGTLNIGAAAGDAAVAAGTLNATTLAFGAGEGMLNFNHTDADYNFDAVISGDGTINQVAGVTRLTADSAGFAGDTNVTGGTLVVGNALGGDVVTVNGGTLSVEGGVLSNATGIIGDFDGDTGTVAVAGTGSTWTNSGALTVGFEGTGTLIVSGGGAVSNTTGSIAGEVGSAGTVTVTGSGSAWTNSSSLTVGNEGAGTLNIADGGAVESTGTGLIGASTSGTGTVTVTGANSIWTNSGVVSVGVFGDGRLTIANGGLVANTSASIGTASTGTVTVTGAGSSWGNTGTLFVGNVGAGTLTIANGGAVGSSSGFIGQEDGSTGRVMVTGTNSIWTNTGELRVGNAAAGTLTIADGGAVSNTSASIGGGSHSTGAVTVTGAGSVWNNSSNLTVGEFGTGTLTIADGGGVISDSTGLIGAGNGSTGTVTVADANSTWTSLGNIVVGNLGTGTLTIAEGGTITTNSGGGTVSLALDADSTGTLNIGAATGNAAAAAGRLHAATLAFGPGTGILNFNHTEVGYNFDAVLAGAGTINQIAGVTNLTGDSSGFAGDTSVTGGLLSVNGTLGGTVTVSGGTLGGSGTLAGDVSVTNGAISAGNSSGTLTIGGDLALASGSSLNFELGSPSGTAGVDSVLINVDGDLTLDGTLNVTDAGGFGAGLYRLVNYDGTLTDNGLEIGDAPNGFGSSNLTVQTATVNQVNLLVDATLVSFWDGANTSANNAVEGGSGTWSVTGTNWTFADGGVNGAFDPSVLLIFSGAAGTVTVDDSTGAISTSAGMQFAADGYTMTGDDIALTGATAFRVGDGTSAGAAFIATIASDLTGAGSLNKTDLGTLVLTGANTYTGGTTISAGTLIGNATSLQGDIVNNAALTFDQGTAGTYAGILSGTGALTKGGAGVLTLSGANTYTGGTTISAGTLIGNATSLQGDIVNNAALIFDQGTAGTYAGILSGTGALTKDGTGALTLSGANTYTGGTTISAGTLIGNATSLQGDIVNNAALIFDQGTAGAYAGILSGTGALTKDGAGTLTLSGANTYTGGTTISAGTLIGNATSLQGDIVNNAALTFDQGTAGTYAGILSGTGALTKDGAGELVLIGDSSAYAGTTDIAAGLLAVNGSLGGAVTVSGGTLGGSGTLTGDVSVTQGVIAAGDGVGTLTIGGDLTLASGSSLDFELGNPSGTAGVDSDLIVVGGDLTLDGTLNVTDTGGFGAGVYRLIDYSGALTDNGLDIGTMPTDFLAGDLAVQTSVTRQINLIVSGPSGLSFWDGANSTANGAVDGGSGTWNATNTNWTNTTGTTNGTFSADALQVFQGTGGTVIIDNTGGAVTTSAMQFAGDGYTISGDDLTLSGSATVRVGDGTAAGAGYSTTIASRLIGTGSLDKTDLGTLVLTGANSYTGGTTISGGTLVGNTASLQGDIVNNAVLVFDQTSDGTYAGVISGSGALTKSGTGTLTLTGDSSAYAGTTDIAAGLLTLNGSLGGVMNVSGGTLGGSGSLGNVTIGSGGTLAPGNSIGTLNVVDITLDAGSTYTVELNDGGFVAGTHNDLVNATGTATIHGGTVHVTPENGTDDGTTYTLGTYTLLTAAGGVTGAFDTLTEDYAFLDFALGYDANNVFLTSSLAAPSFCLTGMTANQCAAGNGVFSLESGSLYTAVLNLSNAEASGALDQLSGEVHASAKTAMIEDSRFLRNAVNGRLRAAFDGVGASGGKVMTYGDGGPQVAAATTERFAFWGQGFGSRGHTDGDGNAARLSRSTGGLFVGADASVFDTWRLGVIVGYSDASYHVKDRVSSGARDDYHVGLYVGATWGNLALRTGVAHTWHDISTSRSVSIPGVRDSLKGDYNASSMQAFGEFGYRFAHGNVAFEPFANLAHVSLDTDGFTEEGGVAALSGENGATDTTFSTLGLRISSTLDMDGASLTVNGMFGWRRAFGDVAPESAMQFGRGDIFAVAGVPIDRDAAVVELGLDHAISPSASLGVSYAGQFGDDLADHSLWANFNIRF